MADLGVLPAELRRLSWPQGFPATPQTPLVLSHLEEISTASVRMYLVAHPSTAGGRDLSPTSGVALGAAVAGLTTGITAPDAVTYRPAGRHLEPAAAPGPAPITVDRLAGYLGGVVARQGWAHNFWPPDKLREHCEGLVLADAVAELDRANSVPEKPLGLFAASLFELTVVGDDSASMRADCTYGSVDCRGRWRELERHIDTLTDVATRFGSGGLEVAFFNAPSPIGGVVAGSEPLGRLRSWMANHPLSGQTYMAEALEQVHARVRRRLDAGTLTRPTMVYVVTDGEPNSRRAVHRRIAGFGRELASRGLPSNGVLYNFLQVGNDEPARNFLAALDADAQVGALVDATSSYALEAEEWRRAGRELSPERYRMKLVVGAADPLWDRRDEPRRQSRRLSHLFG